MIQKEIFIKKKTYKIYQKAAYDFETTKLLIFPSTLLSNYTDAGMYGAQAKSRIT